MVAHRSRIGHTSVAHRSHIDRTSPPFGRSPPLVVMRQASRGHFFPIVCTAGGKKRLSSGKRGPRLSRFGGFLAYCFPFIIEISSQMKRVRSTIGWAHQIIPRLGHLLGTSLPRGETGRGKHLSSIHDTPGQTPCPCAARPAQPSPAQTRSLLSFVPQDSANGLVSRATQWTQSFGTDIVMAWAGVRLLAGCTTCAVGLCSE